MGGTGMDPGGGERGTVADPGGCDSGGGGEWAARGAAADLGISQRRTSGGYSRGKWGKMYHGVNKSTPFSQLLLFQSPKFFY